jgi:ankyrin repeat protein
MTGKNPKRQERRVVDSYGRTALHYAAAENNVAAAQEIIKSGIDINAKDDNQWTALHFAAQANALEVARLLIEAAAEIDPRDSFGNTPLSTAVFNYTGNGDLIVLLRDNKADPYCGNLHGQTPIGLARLISNYDVGKYFADLPE